MSTCGACRWQRHRLGLVLRRVVGRGAACRERMSAIEELRRDHYCTHTGFEATEALPAPWELALGLAVELGWELGYSYFLIMVDVRILPGGEASSGRSRVFARTQDAASVARISPRAVGQGSQPLRSCASSSCWRPCYFKSSHRPRVMIRTGN